MKKFKLLYLLIAFVAVAFATSCTESDDFAAGEAGNGAQVYFSNENIASYNLSDDETSISLMLNRIDAEQALSVSILSDVPADVASYFTIPSSVTFAAGATTANLTISVATTSLTDGTTYNIELLINDEDNTTPYGLSSFGISIARWPWEYIGKGKLRAADAFTGLWDMDFEAEIDVDIYESKSSKGIYMIENPWAMVVTAGWEYEDPLDDIIAYFGYNDTNLVINCTDPAHVFIDAQFTGLTHPTYGEWWVQSLYPNYGNDAGTLEEKVISFPVKGLLFSMSEYKDGSLYYGNMNGFFRVLLPGAEISDYSLAVEYDGMKVEADGETASAIINFTCGADVTGIDYVVVAGGLSDANAATVAASIIDGTAENINKIDNVNETVSTKFALSESGAYTVVAVALDKAGQPTEKGIASTGFFFPGMGGAVAPDCELEVMMGYVSQYWSAMSSQYPDETSLFYEIDGQEYASLVTYLNKTDVIVGSGMTPEEIVDSYGVDRSETWMQKINENGFYGSLFYNLAPGTSYTLIVKATNIYGKSAVKTATYSTKAESFDDYNGELVIGSYKMVYTPNANTTFENTFTIKPVSGSTTEYTITDLGMDDTTTWHAEYDSATNKFICGGIEVGYEEDGNYFGKLYGYWDSAKTMAFAFISVSPDNAESTGADACVFSVDPTTKQITTLETLFYVPVIDLSTNQTLGYGGYFPAGTAVTPVAGASAAKATSAKIASLPVSGNIAIKGTPRNGLKFDAKTAKGFKATRNIATLNVNAQACEPLHKGISRNIKSGAASLKTLK